MRACEGLHPSVLLLMQVLQQQLLLLLPMQLLLMLLPLLTRGFKHPPSGEKTSHMTRTWGAPRIGSGTTRTGLLKRNGQQGEYSSTRVSELEKQTNRSNSGWVEAS